MGIEDIPLPVQQFIQRHIHSVEQLEVLLMLHANPAKEWNADEIAQRLYTAPDAVLTRLRDLVTGAVVVKRAASPAVFQFQPDNEETRQIVETLARVYSERRVSVIALIYAKPNKAIRAFSDAFRLFDPKRKPTEDQNPKKEGQ